MPNLLPARLFRGGRPLHLPVDRLGGDLLGESMEREKGFPWRSSTSNGR